jgi:hypothetical protein
VFPSALFADVPFLTLAGGIIDLRGGGVKET